MPPTEMSLSNPPDPTAPLIDDGLDEIKHTETDGLIVPEEEVTVVTDDVDPLQSNFIWYTPKQSLSEFHKTAGHEWTISGDDMQVLTCTVPQGERFTTEVGSFMFMHPDMKTEVELTCCSSSGGGCSRILGGESCVKVHLINDDATDGGYIGVTPNFPAKIIPINFETDVTSGRTLIAKGGAIMSDLGGVEVGYSMDCNLLRCCCGGLGAFRQQLGSERGGLAFIAAGGTIIHRDLKPDETIIVDGGSVVAFEDSVQLGVTPGGGFCMCCLGGEGCFLTTMTGPGKIWLQSMSFLRFQNAIQVTVQEEEMDRGDKED